MLEPRSQAELICAYQAVLTALNDLVEAERGYRQAGSRADENIWSEALRERCEAARQLIPEDF